MDNIKDWDLLSQGSKNYWILIYQGYSKLNGNDPIPKKYIKYLEKIQKNKDSEKLKKDKKDNAWKYTNTYLGKRGRIR